MAGLNFGHVLRHLAVEIAFAVRPGKPPERLSRQQNSQRFTRDGAAIKIVVHFLVVAGKGGRSRVACLGWIHLSASIQ